MSLNFRCDEESKYEFIYSTNEYIEKQGRFKKEDLDWWAYDSEQDCRTEWQKAPETERLDLYLTIIPINATYAFELKERWGKYTSTYYGEEGQEGWIYNIDKDDYLKKAKDKGYIPIYVNLYPDDKIRLWNISKLTEDDYGNVEKNIKSINIDPNSKRSPEKRYTLMNKTGVMYDRKRRNKE